MKSKNLVILTFFRIFIKKNNKIINYLNNLRYDFSLLKIKQKRVENMKKTSFVILISAISFGVLAKPGFVNSGQETYFNGGFRGPTPALTSIEQAKSLHDDAWVVLVGHVIKQVGHKLYGFRDSSGSTYVEIDDKYWMGQTVSPEKKYVLRAKLKKME